MKPILFNTEMVKALLEGRKTMTRRLIKPQPKSPVVNFLGTWQETQPCANGIRVFPPPYKPGDILYVRETFTEEGGRYYYRADFESDWLDPCETLSGGYPASCRYRNCDNCCAESERIRWRPSIHMPKEAARIFLRVKSVRVERLKSISVSDAMDEGVSDWNEFVTLWDSTVPKHPNKFKSYPYYWKDNPWVWVIEFERISKEEALK